MGINEGVTQEFLFLTSGNLISTFMKLWPVLMGGISSSVHRTFCCLLERKWLVFSLSAADKERVSAHKAALVYNGRNCFRQLKVL